MESTSFMKVDEVAKELGVSKSYCPLPRIDRQKKVW